MNKMIIENQFHYLYGGRIQRLVYKDNATGVDEKPRYE